MINELDEMGWIIRRLGLEVRVAGYNLDDLHRSLWTLLTPAQQRRETKRLLRDEIARRRLGRRKSETLVNP